jgi:hypothetical protein
MRKSTLLKMARAVFAVELVSLLIYVLFSKEPLFLTDEIGMQNITHILPVANWTERLAAVATPP